MPVDPFDGLRAPAVVVHPRRAFAADLRRRLATELGLDPTTGAAMTVTTSTPYKPADTHDITAYICVTDSRAAIEWYAEVFGAVLTYEPIVMDDGRVGHCEVRIGDTTLQMADEFPELGVLSPTRTQTGVSFSVYVEDVDVTYGLAVERGAIGLSAPAEQFYGARTGTVVDPFGHRWTISTWLGEQADR
jgi:uncharacterized glyoxalase superfamily protein PhnB